MAVCVVIVLELLHFVFSTLILQTFFFFLVNTMVVKLLNALIFTTICFTFIHVFRDAFIAHNTTTLGNIHHSGHSIASHMLFEMASCPKLLAYLIIIE